MHAKVLKMTATKMLLMITLLKMKGSEWYSTIREDQGIEFVLLWSVITYSVLEAPVNSTG